MSQHDAGRRFLLKWMAALGVGSVLRVPVSGAQTTAILTRKIPSSGESIPLVGIGSWITFNVGDDPVARRNCTSVLRAFFESGGRMIDSSPMYGSSQEVIGHALERLRPPEVFSADKVWTSSGEDRSGQIRDSLRHWGLSKFTLLQVHNLIGWKAHLRPLFAMKERGELGYVGITTSHGRRHEEIEEVMRSQPVDFVQFTYNPIDREAEQRLLPVAADRGIAVVINRPFQQGSLVERLDRHPLPGVARELDCRSWAQLVLKWIVSHPAVTCAIPATSVSAHARENMGAARGELPDAALRKRIAAEIEKLA